MRCVVVYLAALSMLKGLCAALDSPGLAGFQQHAHDAAESVSLA